jgi:hypothetical protein
VLHPPLRWACACATPLLHVPRSPPTSLAKSLFTSHPPLFARSLAGRCGRLPLFSHWTTTTDWKPEPRLAAAGRPQLWTARRGPRGGLRRRPQLRRCRRCRVRYAPPVRISAGISGRSIAAGAECGGVLERFFVWPPGTIRQSRDSEGGFAACVILGLECNAALHGVALLAVSLFECWDAAR